ncbi:DUF4433 domain-containing protein [Bradyrhizobium sp. 200]|nr:DUF4433 domain-containing protein [Bradyrhizobium sp. 200]
MPKPTPTPLFHITAIDNLRSIASTSLLSKNRVAVQGINFANIAFQTVQGHRSVKLVPIASGGNLHDYVPFHFAPRSPMLKPRHCSKLAPIMKRESGCSGLAD